MMVATFGRSVVLRPRFQESYVDVILSFLRHHLRDTGRNGFVLGMSGGIDSSLVARLCADAVGPAKVLGLALPEAAGGSDEKDARDWAKQLGIGFRTTIIGPMVAAIAKGLKIPKGDRVALGNAKARVRREARRRRARGPSHQPMAAAASASRRGGTRCTPTGSSDRSPCTSARA